MSRPADRAEHTGIAAWSGSTRRVLRMSLFRKYFAISTILVQATEVIR